MIGFSAANRPRMGIRRGLDRRWPQWLGIPHASNVLEIRETGPGWIRVRMNMDGYEQIQVMDLPCLITMDMELACTTLTQIAVMFVIITAGILCSRFGVILGAAGFAISILVPTWIIQQRLPFFAEASGVTRYHRCYRRLVSVYHEMEASLCGAEAHGNAVGY